MKKYYLESFGCQMNISDSETIAGYLATMDLERTLNIADADLVFFHTCCVRDSAESKIVGRIGETIHLKEKKKDLIVVISGCMMQQPGAAELLSKKFPHIDLMIGTSNLSSIQDLLEQLIRNKDKKNKFQKTQIECFNELNSKFNENDDVLRSSWPNAWVPIIKGCNNYCSYCIVPYVRGPEISRIPENIINEVHHLLKNNYKEITLLGQNVNSYGNDLNSDWTFTKLIESISNYDYKYRVRFMTSHPKDLSQDLIEAIAKNNMVSKHIHLPIQAGSDKVLRLMNRKYTQEKYMNLLTNIKNQIPGVSITTDVMVGFPGETEDDFLETMDVINKAQFHNAYMFVYSQRKGTPAASMPNQISRLEKMDRISRLIKLQNSISCEISKKYLNTTYEVLVDNMISGEIYCGRTDNGRLVKFKAKDSNIIGSFVNVKINYNKGSSLWGDII
ncbi:MAG: tRNA (N6-isopentenyl adenosine(37)-C2)-methylthiotransferase MiaB [Clostridiales bacterium]|jgi:tRNA-2-methylthio-N6-dimethylallyladenosine synthase|nr:tRNA (N6-isopentenyl adenosine(37)-C2)-methylthiotransferase MiaB [Clostridiales bacterium]